MHRPGHGQPLEAFPGRLMIIRYQTETNQGQRAVIKPQVSTHSESSALDLTSNSRQCFEKHEKTGGGRWTGRLTASLHEKGFIHIAPKKMERPTVKKLKAEVFVKTVNSQGPFVLCSTEFCQRPNGFSFRWSFSGVDSLGN